MNQAELAQLHDEARAEMKKIPGVVGVGYGFKRTAGQLTDKVGFLVFVREKKDESLLAPNEIIPQEFKGVVTDVITHGVGRLFDCVDHAIHSPLAGGITISNLKPDAGGNFGVGTLGFFATVDGMSGPHNVVFVSNSHVLAANGGNTGDAAYQPRLVQQGGQWLIDLTGKNPVGAIVNPGQQGNHPYTYPGETSLNYFVDCATANIDFCVSTLCHTHCGQSFTDQVINLNVNGSNVIADVARIQQSDLTVGSDYIVYKSGQKTGLTTGKVIGIGVPIATDGGSGDNGIEITPTQLNCDGIFQFADHGDSGAPLINAQGKLVGLVFGGPAAPTSDAWASHIHPVLDYLKVTAVTAANPATDNPAYSSDTAHAIAAPASALQPSVVPALRERLNQTPEGSQVVALIEQHAGEVIHLVNHKRRVTVAWHRNKGPRFLNEAVRNAHNSAHPIPDEIEGVARETLLRRMAAALSECGSAGLRQALEFDLTNILPRLIRTGSLQELIDSLAAPEAV
jgi:hypothetical protein